MSRLQPLNLTDFTGGINSARSDFQLADNESPAILNMEVDPRVGFYTRPGWQRWNPTDIVADPVNTWRPRNAQMHHYSNGASAVFITNNNKVWAGAPNSTLVDLGAVAQAVPHLADPADWGDTVYLACGTNNACWKVTGVPAAGLLGAAMPVAAAATWNNDYTVPKRNVMPRCDHLEPHGGYVFAGNTMEDGIHHHNRVRWSHPDEPEDWHVDDYIDIEQGGGHITALRSFQDHLLIFKDASVWALFGYDSDSWQLVKISATVGVPAPTCVTRSEDAVYFFSASGRNAIYAYNGQNPIDISDKLRMALDELTNGTDIWLSWLGRRLWCSIPWDYHATDNSHGSMFVFDPQIGGGAWLRHKPARGTIACTVENSDIETRFPLVVTCGCTGVAGVMSIGISPTIAGDVFVQGEEAVGYRCRYRTSWKNMGWPELQKSWLRPRVIARVPPEATTVRMTTFWNYNSTNERRSHTFDLDSAGGVFWRNRALPTDPLDGGFNWGDGTNWTSATAQGDVLVRPEVANPATRGTSLGWARAVQLVFEPDDYTKAHAWGIDAIVLKVNMRRFTT